MAAEAEATREAKAKVSMNIQATGPNLQVGRLRVKTVDLFFIECLRRKATNQNRCLEKVQWGNPW
jgi:hypothetical protein